MNSDGSGVTRLTDVLGTDTDTTIAWSPNGKQIAFDSFEDGSYDIFVVSVDGSSIVRLTNSPGNERYPSWSPDGKWLAYSMEGRVYLLNLATNQSQEIAVVLASGVTPIGVLVAHFSWHPDSDFLAYMGAGIGSLVDDEVFLYRISIETGTSLTNNPNYVDRFPAIAPDGEYLAYCSATLGPQSGFDLFTWEFKADGQFRRMTNFQSSDAFQPIWSPDGNWILFSVREGNKWDIYKISRDDEELVKLSEYTVDDRGYYRGNIHPIWSPDGKLIVFESSRDGNQEIYVMNADGSDQKNLSNHSGHDYYPQWQPSEQKP